MFVLSARIQCWWLWCFCAGTVARCGCDPSWKSGKYSMSFRGKSSFRFRFGRESLLRYRRNCRREENASRSTRVGSRLLAGIQIVWMVNAQVLRTLISDAIWLPREIHFPFGPKHSSSLRDARCGYYPRVTSRPRRRTRGRVPGNELALVIHIYYKN